MIEIYRTTRDGALTHLARVDDWARAMTWIDSAREFGVRVCGGNPTLPIALIIDAETADELGALVATSTRDGEMDQPSRARVDDDDDDDSTSTSTSDRCSSCGNLAPIVAGVTVCTCEQSMDDDTDDDR